MSNKKIVLFDLDGTLTPPRGAMELKTVNSLKELKRNQQND